MILLKPNLSYMPGARLVSTALYDSTDPATLTQDLLLVELPGGLHIDVTWAPEHDPDGGYYITVFRNDLELDETTSRDPYETIEIVEDFAERYTSPVRPVSCSRSETVDYHACPAA